MLGNITDISSGHLFRARPDYVESGGYPVIQMKDVLPGEPIDWGKLVRVRLEGVKSECLVRKGDVLLRTKGVSHLATTAGEPLEDTVVASQVAIIRVKEGVLAEFLAWYINQPPAQRYLDSHSVGTNIRHMSIKRLGDLPIEVPDMKTQQLIVNLCRLRRRERGIVEQIQKLRNSLINAAMLKTIGH